MRRCFVLAALVVMLASTAVLAQNPPSGGRRPSGGRGFVTQRFLETAPDIGEPMPEATVYDADGKTHELGELLKGHYSVLVLGCLT